MLEKKLNPYNCGQPALEFERAVGLEGAGIGRLYYVPVIPENKKGKNPDVFQTWYISEIIAMNPDLAYISPDLSDSTERMHFLQGVVAGFNPEDILFH